jgi:hypothetical protein
MFVFAGTNTRAVGSNPTSGVDVCMCSFSIYVVLCVVKLLRDGMILDSRNPIVSY